MKIPTTTDPAHVSDIMSVSRFINVTLYLSCIPELLALKLTKPISMMHSHFIHVCLFWTFWSNRLILYSLEAPFQEKIWSPPFEYRDQTWFSIYSHSQGPSRGVENRGRSESWMLYCFLQKNADHYTVFRFPHDRIMSFVMRYLGTSNVAYSHIER